MIDGVNASVGESKGMLNHGYIVLCGDIDGTIPESENHAAFTSSSMTDDPVVLCPTLRFIFDSNMPGTVQ